MFKIVALAAFIGACYAAEHAYSSQSIVRYDDHNQKHDFKSVKYQVPVKYEVPIKYQVPVKYEAPIKYQVPVKYEVPIKYEVPVKYAVPVKYEVPVLTHKVIPVVTKYVTKAVPVAHYVSENSNQGYGQADSHHAVSSSHIHREDIPAEAPKDFYVEYGHPKYEFQYKVVDPHTKDNKYQHEARDGHVVKGVYSLHDADGSIRTVEYSADKHTGFIADVKHVTKHVKESKHHN